MSCRVWSRQLCCCGPVWSTNGDAWPWSAVRNGTTGDGCCRLVKRPSSRVLWCSTDPVVTKTCLWDASSVVMAWPVQRHTGTGRSNSTPMSAVHIRVPCQWPPNALHATWCITDVCGISFPAIHGQCF